MWRLWFHGSRWLQRKQQAAPMRYPKMGWILGVTFALVIGFGYAVRKRKRMRSRGYYHGD